MKLLNLTNWYYLGFTFLIFSMGSALSYELLKSIIDKQFNEKLHLEKEQFIFELSTYQSLRDGYFLNIGDKIEIFAVDSSQVTQEIISDTTMYDEFAKQTLNFRQVTFSTQVEDQFYTVVISKSLFHNEELVKGIGEIMLIFLTGLGVSLVIMNAFLSKKIWIPFYKIIDHLKSFDVTQPTTKFRESTDIDEFKDLSTSMSLMISKTRKDYKSLKEFTENSSHEIQTPLSIIKTEAELLLQLKSLSSKNLKKVKSIYSAAGRLSKINQSLTLLTKIENKQFEENQALDLVVLINDIIEKTSELMSLNEIKVDFKIDGKPTIIINKELAYILFSNLIINAIKHNNKDGFINIAITDFYFNISNSGAPLKKNPNSLFDRFKKDKTSNSPGLGLALVKEICNSYNLIISYRYKSGLHKISIQF